MSQYVQPSGDTEEQTRRKQERLRSNAATRHKDRRTHRLRTRQTQRRAAIDDSRG